MLRQHLLNARLRKLKMDWDKETQFRAVLVDANNPQVEVQRLPTRDTIEEVKADIDCFFHNCSCYKILEKFPAFATQRLMNLL